MMVLVLLGIAIPIYQALCFDLQVDLNLLLRVILSLIVAIGFYSCAFGVSKFMSQLSLAMYKSNIDNFLSILQVLIVASSVVFYWESITLPDWSTYDGVFNSHLILFATYYGIAFYCFRRKFVPSFKNVNEEGDSKNSESIGKSLVILSAIIVLLFAIQLQKIDGLKSELYLKSVKDVQVNQIVLDELGSNFEFSFVVTGKISNDYGRLLCFIHLFVHI
ncbi:hypothetical protein KJ365_06715 [Glaciecola sp. XM2]|uniref:hypothetical protein n=1 Tax=Glaciecola sp. XM2 TaxID=1914931 RepID=UPI001BDEC4EC|nr:hypothetical protein [Glaciecola sp. XM2]MBT1450570.1 hypothetical protein [Glaciecola sp. XM2]